MVKNLLLWLVIAAVLVSVFNNFNPQAKDNSMSYSHFVEAVQQGRVDTVKIDGLEIKGEFKSGDKFVTVRPYVEDPDLMNDLLSHNVSVEGVRPERQSLLTQLLVASFPILIFIAVFMFFMRQMQGGMGGRGGPMSFGKSKARMLAEDQIKTRFADVAGCDDADDDADEEDDECCCILLYLSI